MTASQRLPLVIETPPKNPPEETYGSFDDCIVIPQQLETAVCWNANGDLVIRQRNWPGDDRWIVITENQVDVFLDKLTEICGIPSFGK
jgi:hypothetical protein